MLGIVSLRKRLGRMPQLRAAIVLGVLSLGAIMGSTGCAGGPARSLRLRRATRLWWRHTAERCSNQSTPSSRSRT